MKTNDAKLLLYCNKRTRTHEETGVRMNKKNTASFHYAAVANHIYIFLQLYSTAVAPERPPQSFNTALLYKLQPLHRMVLNLRIFTCF